MRKNKSTLFILDIKENESLREITVKIWLERINTQKEVTVEAFG